MMKISKISKSFASLLALMILVSSLSYTIDFHYCQGQLKSFSLFGKAKNCHEMTSKMASCKHHKKQVVENSLASIEDNKNCCSNETIKFELEFDDKVFHYDNVNVESDFTAVVYNLSSFNDLFGDIQNLVPYTHYKPPLIQKDITVLFDTFLI